MKIALLGCGQIGGSFAAALKKSGADVTITAFDQTPEHALYLRDHHYVDRIAASAADAVNDADIVMLATPLRSYQAIASAIAPHVKTHAIVTDVGSVKASMQAIKPLLKNQRLVPGHPIAGIEKSGPEATNADLFRQRLVLLTPDATTDAAAVQAVETLWHLTGANTQHIDTAAHDAIYARVSHLPHFIAFVAAQLMADYGIHLDAGDASGQQFLRLSRSNPRMWADIALENRTALRESLRIYIGILHAFKKELESGTPGAQAESALLAKTLLPRVLASALIATTVQYEQEIHTSLKAFAGAGMRDVSAPAHTPPEADTKAMSESAAAMAGVIQDAIERFTALDRLIAEGDDRALHDALSTIVQKAHAVTGVAQADKTKSANAR